MHVDKGGADHTGGEGGGREAGGGDEAGGGEEEGEEGTVDGVLGWAWVGKEGQLSQNLSFHTNNSAEYLCNLLCELVLLIL